MPRDSNLIPIGHRLTEAAAVMAEVTPRPAKVYAGRGLGERSITRQRSGDPSCCIYRVDLFLERLALADGHVAGVDRVLAHFAAIRAELAVRVSGARVHWRAALVAEQRTDSPEDISQVAALDDDRQLRAWLDDAERHLPNLLNAMAAVRLELASRSERRVAA